MRDNYDIERANNAGLIPATECVCGEVHLVAGNVMRKITPRAGRLFIYYNAKAQSHFKDSLIRVIQPAAHGYILAEDIRPFGGSLIGLVPVSDLQPVDRRDVPTVRRHIHSAEAAHRAHDYGHEDHHRGMALRMAGLGHS